MMICSIAFVVIPITLSMVQLLRATDQWRYNNAINAWLIRHSTLLFIMSFMTGSAFTAISLVNCNAFRASLFWMGLSKMELIQWNNQRIWSIVFLEVFIYSFG